MATNKTVMQVRDRMHLVFNAQEVTYAEALGGDIVQVSFQEEPDPDIDYSKKNCPLPPPTKSVCFSACYEFPPCDTTVEWCDGEDYDGGKSIKEVVLTKTSLKVVLENEFRIDVNFQTDDITFKNIQNFLVGSNK
ncbi:MAG: hypothetical protein V7677_19625 [Motiliproteus sp.]